MKKSFMTRALATGLSLAMAFSLAATDVTDASAAVDPDMMSKEFNVTVDGPTKTFKMVKAARTKYNITKATIGKKKVATPAISKNKKKITLTPGTRVDTAYVTITFKNINKKAKNYGKTTKKKYKTTLHDKKQEEVKELTMTAEATGVKKLLVKFNQAVDTATAITVAKGSAATTLAAKDAVVWNTDATEATLTTAGKLTEGTYTVTAKVAEDKTLTADVVVEKNETLTSFKLVGETLKATSAKETTSASIKYQALNQYDEPMNCSSANVTIAPGKADPTSTTPTATKPGEAKVTDIPDTYANPYTNYEFSVVIVDTATGVHFEGKVKYGACAKAGAVEQVGLYSVSKGRLQDMTAGDRVSDYEALFTVKDQYGDPYTVTADDVKDNDAAGTKASLTITAISGLTNVAVNTATLGTTVTRTVDEVEYFAVPLKELDTATTTPKKTAVAGEFSLMFVNNTIGPVGTASFTVSDSVVIQSIDISADAIYAGQANEMTYNIVDTKGNAVTAYKDLQNIVFGTKGEGSLGGTMKFEKKTDGTAKLVYTPKAFENDLKSNIEVYTITANEVTSTSYYVRTFSFTVLAQRKAQAVVGVSSSVATSTAKSNVMTLNFKDLLIEDQYGNLFTSDELGDGTKMVSGATIFVTTSAIANANALVCGEDSYEVTSAAWTVTAAAANVNEATGAAFTAGYVRLAPPSGTDEVVSSYNININGKTGEGYTLKLYKVKNGNLPNVTSLKIESINKGYPVQVTEEALTVAFEDEAKLTTDNKTIPVVVSGMVNGQKVFLDAGQCDAKITAAKLGAYTAANVKNEKATVEITVSTADGPVVLTEQFDISNEPPALKTISKDSKYDAAAVASKPALVSPATIVSGAAYSVSVAQLAKGFEAKDQYGNPVSDLDSNVKYTVSLKGIVDNAGKAVNDAQEDLNYGITNNYVSGATVWVNGEPDNQWKVTFTVVAETGTDKVEYDIVLWTYDTSE